MSKLRLLSFFVVAIATVIISIVISYWVNNNNMMSCRGEGSLKRNQEELSLVIAQQLHSGQGTLSISGILSKRDQVLGYLSKTVTFTYQQDGNLYRMKSTHIVNSPQMTLPVEKERAWFPAFFIDEGALHTLEMKPYGSNSWLIYAHTVPLFICEKNR